MSINIGDVFTRLTVIAKADDRVSPNGKRRKYWLCKCSCDSNKTVEVRADGLTALKGSTKSCGCLIRETAVITNSGERLPSLIGQVFGRLTVIAPAEAWVTPKGYTRPMWTCSCKCGNTYNVLQDSLRAGQSVSCGCVPPRLVDSEIKNKSELFVFRAKEVHGERFDYSLVDYKHSTKNVIIICREHGQFQQLPSNHIRGKGCPKCSAEERASRQHWDYLERCKLNDNLANAEAVLYLLKLNSGNEAFLKLGVSTTFKNRLSRYRKEGLNYEVVEVVNTTAMKAALLEKEVLKYIKYQGFKYTPTIVFGGWTECATLESEGQLVEVLRRLSSNE